MQDLKIAGIQFDIVWKNKQANFQYLEAEFEIIADVDLIVLPEMFQTGFCFDVEALAEDFEHSETINWLKNWAQKKDCAITGSLMIRDNGQVFNRLIWMNADGNLSYYDKRHLFSMSDEPQHFTAGNSKLLVELKGWKICPMVCYDLRFPVWIRNVESYDLLIFIANWPKRRSMHWEKLLQARAIENQCYVLGINRVGNDGTEVYHDGRSAVISPLGEPICSAINSSEILYATISKTELTDIRQKMPFLKDSDSFELKS